MATAAKRLQKAQEMPVKVRKSSTPAVNLKIGRRVQSGPVELGKLLRTGFALKRQMDDVKNQLATVNDAILDIATPLLGDAETMHILYDGIDCTVIQRDSVSIADVDGLRSVLGEYFPALVKEKVSYAPEVKLVEMALDADNPRSTQVANCLFVQAVKPGITYRRQ